MRRKSVRQKAVEEKKYCLKVAGVVIEDEGSQETSGDDSDYGPTSNDEEEECQEVGTNRKRGKRKKAEYIKRSKVAGVKGKTTGVKEKTIGVKEKKKVERLKNLEACLFRIIVVAREGKGKKSVRF